jgi:hypothetical protein
MALARRLADELVQHRGLVLVVGEMKRAGLLMPHAAGAQHGEPMIQTAPREIVRCAVRLPDRPQHAEIANRRPDGPLPAFEHQDPCPAPRPLIGVREAEDACANHRHIEPLAHLDGLTVSTSGSRVATI